MYELCVVCVSCRGLVFVGRWIPPGCIYSRHFHLTSHSATLMFALVMVAGVYAMMQLNRKSHKRLGFSQHKYVGVNINICRVGVVSLMTEQWAMNSHTLLVRCTFAISIDAPPPLECFPALQSTGALRTL